MQPSRHHVEAGTEMQYMMLIISGTGDWDGLSQQEERARYAQIESWWNERAAAGEIVGGHELQSAETATTVHREADGTVNVTDGPFVEGKEMVGGYAILDVPDLDAAIRLAASWPTPGTCEIRPIVQR